MATKLLMKNVLNLSNLVMTDVNKYFENMEDEERRSHPFGVTNILMNGLNGRKSKTNLDTGRSLTWICFFCLVMGMCAVIIYLSAQAAIKAKQENCEIYQINCDTTTEYTAESNESRLTLTKDIQTSEQLSSTNSTTVKTERKKRKRSLSSYFT